MTGRVRSEVQEMNRASAQAPMKLIILGTGGNSIDILDAINEINARAALPRYECVGYLDDDDAKWGKEIAGVPVLGPLSNASRYADARFVNGIGSPSSFWAKDSIVARTRVPIDRFESIIHPTASISRMSCVGRGVVILQHVTVASNVVLGDHVIILPNSVVSHDAVLGDYTCVASGVCISGGVRIGRFCYLGANSAIRQQTTIADYSLIGMSSVVLDDVDENSVVVGNPARFLRHTRGD